MPRHGDNIHKRTITKRRVDGSEYQVEFWQTFVDLGTDSTTGKRIRKTLTGDSHGAVSKKRRDLLGQRDKGVKPIHSAKDWTAGSWCDHRVETIIKTDEALTESTYFCYRGDVTNSIMHSPIGRRALAKLEASEVDDWKAWLTTDRKLSAGTRRWCLTVLRKALREAKRQNLVVDNVAGADFVNSIHVPKPPEPVAMSQAQVTLLLARAKADKSRYYPMYALGLTTGMRQGELLGLTWAHGENDPGLDLERGTVRIRQQVVRPRGKPKLVQRVKRGSIRNLYLDANVLDILRRHHTRLLEDQLKAGSKWQENGLAFPSVTGRLQRNTNVWTAWKRLLKRAGLPTTFKFHAQRSTAASLAIADGASLFEVSRMLGHADIRTTANQYGHLFEESKRAMGERMGRVVFGAVGE
jgi:integrase